MCWLESYYDLPDAEWLAYPDERKEVLQPSGIVIQRNLIPSYRCDNFWECVRIWQVWQTKSILPYSGGYYEMPADLVDMFDLFDVDHNSHQVREAEKARQQNAHGRTRR